MPSPPALRIAYFSAEFGLDSSLPVYAGGLGVLAGDVLKEASDLEMPVVGIGLFYHHGFYRQKVGADGKQVREEFVVHPREAGLEEVRDPKTNAPLRVEINFPAEPAEVGVWKKMVGGVPLYFLDAAVPVNEPFEVEYTGHLYEGEWSPRIAQEILLGVGGVRLLRKLGLEVDIWHINDDHAAFAVLERIRAMMVEGSSFAAALEAVGASTVLTTHTPVAGAESLYPPEVIWPYLGILFNGVNVSKDELLNLGGLDLPDRAEFSLSVLAMRASRGINAVSRRHQQIAKKLWQFVFPGERQDDVPIEGITNGVHVSTWVSRAMDRFYRKYLGKDYLERVDQHSLWEQVVQQESAEGDLDLDLDLWSARQQSKQALIGHLEELIPASLWSVCPSSVPREALFLGFARRMTAYKRANLLIADLERLAWILTSTDRPVYLFVSGKAHPADQVGQGILEKIIQAAKDPRLEGHLIFLENYDFEIAKLLVAGVDLWLNTPRPPMEASGTSGMKAVYNGVLNLSVSDGWWYEAGNNEVGWVLGPKEPDLDNLSSDKETADYLYRLLEEEVVPLYYLRKGGIPTQWLAKVRTAIAELGPRFNTRRMLKEYQAKLYR